MASVNKVILIGNLGQDPEIRYSADGAAIAKFSLATNERFKTKEGQWEERTEWHRVVFFGRTAEVCGQYLQKGRTIYVEGSLRTNKWEDKEGNTRYTTEVIGQNMQMLGGRGGDADDGPPQRGGSGPGQRSGGRGGGGQGGGQRGGGGGGGGGKRPYQPPPTTDDDIPF